MRRCRYRSCRREFFPPKPNYYFCSWSCHQAHFAGNDYRGYRRRSDESYDRGFWDGTRARPSAEIVLPAHLWKAFAVLIHPDRWGDASDGIKALSHECMVWLNAHKPEGAERN
jgi:hypothetical protein